MRWIARDDSAPPLLLLGRLLRRAPVHRPLILRLFVRSAGFERQTQGKHLCARAASLDFGLDPYTPAGRVT